MGAARAMPPPAPLPFALRALLFLLLLLLAAPPAASASASAASESDRTDRSCAADAAGGDADGAERRDAEAKAKDDDDDDGADSDSDSSARVHPHEAIASWIEGGAREGARFFDGLFSGGRGGGKEEVARAGEGNVERVRPADGGAPSGPGGGVGGSLFDNVRGFLDDTRVFLDRTFGGGEGGGGGGAADSPPGGGGGARRPGDDPLSGLGRLFRSAFFDDGTSEEEAIRTLLDKARRLADGGRVNETRTFGETFRLFSDSWSEVSAALDRHFGSIDLGSIGPASFFYLMEREEEFRNPAWKRRAHRFMPAVGVAEALELHDALWLAELSYADSAEVIRERLGGGGDGDGGGGGKGDGGGGTEDGGGDADGYELVYVKTDSAPGEPAHFVALKRRQDRRSDSLEVLISVRGTKQPGDVLSDALLDAADYRGGKAHAGVAASGRYLANKHEELLRGMLDMSKKRRVKLVLVGHSLGAGAASVAAVELGELDFVDATVVGFGCPALLSRDLADATGDRILTVVADSDVVPRMSGATMGNAALDAMSLDWTDRALRDVRQLVDRVRADLPFDPFPEGVMDLVRGALDKVRGGLSNVTDRRAEPLLVPPGRCVHFYRDGRSYSGRHTPCAFFDSVEVSPTMIDDHMTGTGYHRALLEFVRAQGGDANFRFRREPMF